MATFYLLPDGVTGTNNWTCSVGSDFVTLVDEDFDGTYIWETLINGEITYTFADPSVAEANIDFGEDVTVSAFAHAHYTHSALVAFLQLTTAGTDILLPGVTQNVDDSVYPAYAGTSGTTKNAGVDWDYAGLQNLQMKLKLTNRAARFHYLRVSYVFFQVDYTEAAVAVTDNATFFGSNF